MDLAKLAAENRMRTAMKQIGSSQHTTHPNAASKSSTSQKPQTPRPSSRTSGLPADFKPPTLKQLLGRLDTERTELKSRKHLSKGIKADAKACEAHVNGLRALKEIQNRGEGVKLKIIFAKDPTIMDLTITTDTALMPLCYQCLVKETGYTQGDSLPELDECKCTTKVLRADCVYCAIGELEQKKLAALKDRTRTTTQGMVVIVCQCGSIVQGAGKARKCAGCDGIVTEPFKNFAGEAVTFVPHSAAIEKEPQAKSTSQKLNEGILDTLTPALLMTRMTGSLIAAENDPWLLEEALDRETPVRILERKTKCRLEYGKSVATLADRVMLPYLRMRSVDEGVKRSEIMEMEDLKIIWKTCGFRMSDRKRLEDFVKRRWGGEVKGGELMVVLKAGVEAASL